MSCQVVSVRRQSIAEPALAHPETLPLVSVLVHHEVILPITGGRLDLGPWQQVYYAGFDGMRRKRVILEVMGE